MTWPEQSESGQRPLLNFVLEHSRNKKCESFTDSKVRFRCGTPPGTRRLVSGPWNTSSATSFGVAFRQMTSVAMLCWCGGKVTSSAAIVRL